MARSLAESLPLVLVPGLTCTARPFAPQIVALWRYLTTGLVPAGAVLKAAKA